MVDWIIVSIYVLSFGISFSFGANDAANSLATTYGSKGLKLVPLVILGAVCEFVGAMFLSSRLASNLVPSLIPSLNPDLNFPEKEEQKMMLGASIAAFCFIISSSIFSIPISGTHTMVGAIIGAGVSAVGWSGIHWKMLIKIVASWFVSPALSAVLTFGLMFLLVWATLDLDKHLLNSRLLNTSLTSAFATALSGYMFVILLPINLTGYVYGASIGGSFLLGLFACRLLVLVLLLGWEKMLTSCTNWCRLFSFWDFRFAQQIIDDDRVVNQPFSIN